MSTDTLTIVSKSILYRLTTHVMISLLVVVVYSKLLRTSCDYQLSTISWLGV